MTPHSLTTGPVTRTLLKFALPYLLANLLQTFYGLVDLLVVGQFSDAANIAAVSLGSMITSTVNSLVIGLTTGGTVLVGQLLGAKRDRDMEETVSTMFTFFPLVSLVLTAVMCLLAAPLLRLMNTPVEAYDGAYAYVQICFVGLFFTAGYNTLSAALRGMGDSMKPLLFVAIACVCNIVGDIILVGPLHMGAAGAAIATTASQGISTLLGVIYLKRKKFLFDFRARSFRIHWDKVRQLLRLGIPISLQEFLSMCSFLILEAIINGMGYIATAAAGVCDKVFMVAVIPSSAFSAAIAAMVAQNAGAGAFDRVRACLRTGLIFSFLIGVALFAWMALAPESAIRLFTGDTDVIAAACNYLTSYKFEYPLCSLVFCINGFINGTGHTRFTLAENLVSTFIVRLPLFFLFSLSATATLGSIGVAMPLASASQLIMVLIYLKTGLWKRGIMEASAQ